MKKLLSFLILLLMIPLVLSQGICETNKQTYHPGETILYDCLCTSPLEEGQIGWFIWRNNSGGIVRNVTADSNACRTSFFTDQFTIPRDFSSYGNVTIEDMTNFNDPPDILDIAFNVSGAHITDCIIKDVTASPVNLGELGAVKITLEDGLTNNTLTHVACQAEGYDINSSPLIFEPYGIGWTPRYTMSGGEVGFQHLMSESIWETNTTYLFEFHCNCINESGYECFDEETGLNVGFKSCNTKVPFITGIEDNRTNDMRYSIASILVIIGLIFIFVALAFLFHKKGTTKETEGDISGSKDLIKDANWFKVLELFTILFILFLTIFLNNAGKLIAVDSGATTPILNMFDTLHISLIAVTVLFLTIMMMRFFVLLIENFKREKLEEEMGIRNKK